MPLHDTEIKSKPSRDGGMTHTHPSFGMIKVSRGSCTPPQRYFGAEHKSDTFYSITISKAQVTQDLGQNWFFGYKSITHVEMTPLQYVELITNPNTEGVPCTIKTTQELGCIQYRPIEEMTQVIKSAADKEMDDLKNRVENIESEVSQILNQKGTLKKADRERLSSLVGALRRTMSSTLPFYRKQFDEALERKKQEAKSEISATIEHAKTTLGSAVLEDPETFKFLLQKEKEKLNPPKRGLGRLDFQD